ncbi:MAG: GIY-YIG nuclease family protein [Clostridia bacterium]|nr:GIY-YIG nuclease family protein [Clostridia bacterium]
MAQEFFIARPAVTPTIYAYELVGVNSHKGYIKVGYTDRDVETRVKEQLHTSGIEYKILLKESAMRNDGTCFTDHEIHKVLKRKGFIQLKEGLDKNEWFKCEIKDVIGAINYVRDGIESEENRTLTFKMRPEQTLAVQKTIEFFEKSKKDDTEKAPKFLWNAKMRFGKTFAAYELAKKLNFKRILVLTFKPAVESAWRDDLVSHVDFEGWQFVSNKDAHDNKINIDEQFDYADKNRPIVVFGSFQDLLGTNENGGIKAKNEFIHTTQWDLVIFDEYHFGAWRENAKKLFENPDEEENADFDMEYYKQTEADNAYNETFLPITTGYYLFLSGTPFRAINSGEFIEDQIYNWTYSDEQSAKENWMGSNNPYLSLPRMVMLTYRIPDSIRQIALQGEFDEFDLNVFFSAKGKGDEAKFIYENEVQKWLDLIRGSYLPSSVDDLKLGQDKRPPMPFSDTRLLNVLSHTLWFLPNVAGCYAMANLLKQKQNAFYHDYKINVCAGTGAGVGLAALYPVQNSMGNPLETKTITLSCGKLTTGVTIRPWTGVFMLRNLKSPETYFQTAFRVQSPWEITDNLGNKQIMKQECYVFDFSLDRALRQISDYSCRLNVEESNPEKKVADFIHFLPVLAYDGSTMKQINAQDILDIAMAGTSATLLAKRWESALLVNVDNDTLSRLLANKDALDALMRIEGFRSLNQDITAIINKSEAVKKAKKEKETKLTEKEKKELTQEEKEYKSMRKQIQEKLIKFATRVPVFMYLTDYRERSLKDVITQLEPGLFKKVTGLDVKDFNLLCSIGVFNASLMNDAIFKFKRYEDSSLSYTGIEKSVKDEVGGWDTVIRREEYEKLFFNQQASMQSISEAMIEEIAISDDKPKDTQKNNPYVITTTQIQESEGKKAVFDYSKVIVGAEVTHAKFGDGTIVNIDKAKKYIKIKFAVGEKLFTYDSFEKGFLKIK